MEHLGTLVSLFLGPKIGMDITQSMLLSKVIDSVSSKMTHFDTLPFSSYWVLCGIAVVVACYLVQKSRLMSYFNRSTSNVVYEVYDTDGITAFANLFKHYTDLFDVCSVEHGTFRNTGNSNTWVLPCVNTSFCLPEENVTGVMCAMYTQTTMTRTTFDKNNIPTGGEPVKIEKLFIRITLSGNIVSYAKLLRVAHEYYTKWVADYNERIVKLYGVNVFLKYSEKEGITSENVSSVILEIPRREYNRNVYFENYFSPLKAVLMEYCKLDQCNLLLYGPPGTGKSVLIHTMAMYTERHIVNVDLTVLTKKNAYQILACACISNFTRLPHQYIIVFEEFDNTIRVLIERERVRQLEERNAKKKGAFKFAKYMSSTVSTVKENPDDSQMLRISDLLALFQSCIPRKGQMLIATTNHYEKMRSTLPALFRPGRMTPILIDYADRKTVSELVVHYFPDTIEIPILPRDHRLPTSQIIELAKVHHADYTQFEQGIRKALSEMPDVEISDTTYLADSSLDNDSLEPDPDGALDTDSLESEEPEDTPIAASSDQ